MRTVLVLLVLLLAAVSGAAFRSCQAAEPVDVCKLGANIVQSLAEMRDEGYVQVDVAAGMADPEIKKQIAPWTTEQAVHMVGIVYRRPKSKPADLAHSFYHSCAASKTAT